MRTTPLHVAVIEEQVEVVADLINQGFDINAQDKNLISPLHFAVETRNLKILKLLLDAGANVHARIADNKKTKDSNTPLHKAIKSNNVQILKLFLNAIGVNSVDDYKFTPLHLAARWGNSNTLKFLLDAKADVNAKNVKGYTPIYMAIKSENVNVLKLLLEAGAEVNVSNIDWCTPLHKAMKTNKSDIIKLLIDSGTCIDAESYKKGYNPLHYAIISNCDIKILQMIIDAGAVVNTKAMDGNTPLHLAVKQSDNSGCANYVKFLINCGADVNLKNYDQCSPLHLAAENKATNAMEELIRAGGSMNDLNENKETPSMIIFKMSALLQLKELRFLIEFTDLNIKAKNNLNIVEIINSKYWSYVKDPESTSSKTHFVELKKLIVEHIAKLKILKLHVDTALIKIIFNVKKYESHFTKCTEELENLKKTKLNKCWVTFFDLLVNDEYQIVKFAGNRDLVEDFKNNSEKFPIYRPWMQAKMENAIKGRQFFDVAAQMMSYRFIPIFNPDHLILRGILDCLTKEDWKRLNFVRIK